MQHESFATESPCIQRSDLVVILQASRVWHQTVNLRQKSQYSTCVCVFPSIETNKDRCSIKWLIATEYLFAIKKSSFKKALRVWLVFNLRQKSRDSTYVRAVLIFFQYSFWSTMQHTGSDWIKYAYLSIYMFYNLYTMVIAGNPATMACTL